MRYVLLGCLWLLTACANTTHVAKSTQADATAMPAYHSVTVGAIAFDPSIDGAAALQQTFSEKLKTEIFAQGLGDRYVAAPGQDTLRITAHIAAFSYGTGNLRIMLPAVAEGNIEGTIELQDHAGQPISTLDAYATTVGGTIVSGFGTSNGLMDMLAADAVREVKRLLEGKALET